MGFLDTYNSLIWPYLAGAFGDFLLRPFFQTVPQELEEAAIMDGARTFTIYWGIILPLAKSALTAVGILTFTVAFFPVLVVYTIFQRSIVEGISLTGLAGR